MHTARRMTLGAAVLLCTSLGVLSLTLSIAPASAEITHRYETQILGPSPTESFGVPWGLAFNSSGNLLVADAQQKAIDVFDPSNVFAPPQITSSAFTQRYTRSVAVAATGTLYVGESGPENVDVLKPEGANKYKLLDAGHERHFGGYVYVAVDNSTSPSDERKGDVYVLALGRIHVIKPNAEGELLETGEELPVPPGGFTTGGRGSGGLAVDAATGNVYVANPGNDVVNVFNDKGEEQPLLAITGAGAPESSGPFTPTAIAVYEANETVYVVDSTNNAVDEFSTAGSYIAQAKQTTSGKQLVEPLGVAIQTHAGPTAGELYVSDGAEKVVDVFGAAGVVLPDVTTGEASGVTRTAVTLSGSVNPDEVSVSGCRFEYRASDELTFVHSEPCSTSPGSGGKLVPVSATIGGLTLATTYRYRLTASNANGANYGLEKSVTTAPAVDAVSTGAAHEVGATKAKLTGSLSPDSTDAHYYFQYGTSTEYGATSPAAPGIDAGTGGAGCEPPGGGACSPVSAQMSVSGLQSEVVYHYRLVAVNSFGTTYGEDATFTTAGPVFRSESVADVTSSSATFEAAIDPDGAPTSYYFQYSTTSTANCEASPSSCTSVPAPPGEEIGSGEAVVGVRNHVQGLQAGTSYHYRVVITSEPNPGEVETLDGPDAVLTTQTAAKSTLPDDRQWEMVSPPDKQGAFINNLSGGAVDQAAADGNAMTFLTNAPSEAEPHGNAAAAQVMSTRGSEGWSSLDISPTVLGVVKFGLGTTPAYPFFSDDLSHGTLQPLGAFVPQRSDEASEQTAYLEDLTGQCASSCFRPLVTDKVGFANVPAGTSFGGGEQCTVECGPQIVDATSNLSHMVLRSAVALTPDAVGGKPDQLYEWTAGKLTLISLLPENGGTVEAPHVGGGTFNEGNDRGAISGDGSRIVWSAGQGLFMRDVALGKTIQLDAAEPSCVAEGQCETGGGRFQIANSDDSKVFFTDERRLTAGSSPGRADLYECEMVEAPGGEPECKLTDLTPAKRNAAGEVVSAEVVGPVLASEDGSYVYFAANGVFANKAVPGECEQGFRGPSVTCNLYVRHDGVTKLVAIIFNEDLTWEGNIEWMSSRVSPDGRWLAFMSHRSLTGYDNHDAISGVPDDEVYLYDATAERVVCASCNPTGARPVGVEGELLTLAPVGAPAGLLERDGGVAANVPGWVGSPHAAYRQPRYLSDSGRLFFDSNDALVPQDVNGTQDVYQYEPSGVGNCSGASVTFNQGSGGCVGLISSGTSAQESVFYDASESGGDAFFATFSRLVPQDYDASADIYDAHECTAASPCAATPAPTPPACTTAEACRAAPSPQPTMFGAPSSATFSGAGNVVPATSSTQVKVRSLTRAQRLASALKACKRKPKHKQAQCERRARVRYGLGKAGKSASRKGNR